jgi:hypothetical protein
MEPRGGGGIKKKRWESSSIDMFLSAVSVLVVVQLSSEVPEGLMNNPACHIWKTLCTTATSNLGRCESTIKNMKMA